MITNIKLILLVIVLLILNTNIIEPLVTYRWNVEPRFDISSQNPCSDTTSLGFSQHTYCGYSHDSCWDTINNRFKRNGETCINDSGITGECRNYNNKFICNVSDSNINERIIQDIDNQEPIDIVVGENYYTIVKNGLDKTHAPMCSDTCIATTLPIDTTSPIDYCSAASNTNCCLCSMDGWDKVYTSTKNDTLSGETINFNNLPIFDGIPDKMGFSIKKLSDPRLGNITENKKVTQDLNDNFKRYFELPVRGLNLDEQKNYTPSKGFFFNQFNQSLEKEHTYSLNEYPDYIQSRGTETYMEDNFYYEECLYNKINNDCQCPRNSIFNPNFYSVEFKENNPTCSSCPQGSVSQEGSCVECSEHNKVLGDTGDCVDCDTYCGNRNMIKCIYRDGQCYDIDTSDKLIRSDCLSKDSDILLDEECNVTAYGNNNGNNLYHLSNDNDSTLEQFYETCLVIPNCEVRQSLIDINEGYINYNEQNHYNQLGDDDNKIEYNIITNEYCNNIENDNSCNQLKQCSWNNGICHVNINNNKYVIRDGTDADRIANVIYHYIPIPHYSNNVNYLTRDCSGRSLNDCNDNICSWNIVEGRCEDICSSLTRDDCSSKGPYCEINNGACSINNTLSCNPPSNINEYSKKDNSNPIINFGQSVSEINFNNTMKCKNLNDYNEDSTSNIDYSGEPKGFCFDFDGSQGILTPTGCIESNIVNDLLLYKSNESINHAIDQATSGQDNLILENKCKELCELNSDICEDYGIKYPTDKSIESYEEAGCYLMKRCDDTMSSIDECNLVPCTGSGDPPDCIRSLCNGLDDPPNCIQLDCVSSATDPYDGCIVPDCIRSATDPYDGCRVADCVSSDTDPYPDCNIPECTSVDDPFVGCLCAGTFNPEGCIPRECTTDTDTPHVGCIVPECTSIDDPFVGCLCAGTFNPEGCIPRECTDIDTPHVGCIRLDCTAEDTPHPGCVEQECIDSITNPYPGCIRQSCTGDDTPHPGCITGDCSTCQMECGLGIGDPTSCFNECDSYECNTPPVNRPSTGWGSSVTVQSQTSTSSSRSTRSSRSTSSSRSSSVVDPCDECLYYCRGTEEYCYGSCRDVCRR